MKKILLSFLLIVFSGILTAQSYYHFPDSNAVWSEYHQPPISSGDMYYYYRNAITNKDTIIAAKTYHQIFYSLTDTTFINPDNYYYIGGLRENNKQIFFVPKDSTNEYLIYDFSLNIGDTIIYYYSAFSVNYGFGMFEYLSVIGIDSVLIYDGTYRKRMYFEGWSYFEDPVPIYYSYWIEGIGNNMGLLCPISNLPTNGATNKLICLKQNDNLIYINNNYNDCYPIIVNINENTIHHKEIRAYPNPVTNTSIIKWDKNIQFSVLEIYNVLGKTILKTNINNISYYTIDGNVYDSGIYFIKLSDNNSENFVTKFIKK